MSTALAQIFHRMVVGVPGPGFVVPAGWIGFWAWLKG
ncbi:UNVERIFIED_ORG: hypothetical protein ABIB19_003996, partial [Arthrobacter sp. UYEF10]